MYLYPESANNPDKETMKRTLLFQEKLDAEDRAEQYSLHTKLHIPGHTSC